LSFNYDDFDDPFGDANIFNSKLMKRFQTELNEILEGIKSGKIKGKWEIKQIDEPGADGYVIRGRFGADEPLDPLEPLKPLKRRPMPERPLEVPKNALEEDQEPLIDVFEEENAIKIYVELPGEEKNNIRLTVTPGNLEIKTENFHKTIDLPTKKVAVNTLSSEYKNGVLEITVQKNEEPGDKWAGKQIVV
jgi:HSP20 family molecular chaperone IbpA